MNTSCFKKGIFDYLRLYDPIDSVLRPSVELHHRLHHWHIVTNPTSHGYRRGLEE